MTSVIIAAIATVEVIVEANKTDELIWLVLACTHNNTANKQTSYNF